MTKKPRKYQVLWEKIVNAHPAPVEIVCPKPLRNRIIKAVVKEKGMAGQKFRYLKLTPERVESGVIFRLAPYRTRELTRDLIRGD